MSWVSRGAKKLLPKAAKRFILFHFMGIRRPYRNLRLNPSRLFLERDILPWLGQHYAKVLFVGTAPYTYQFERLFRRSRGQFTTIDPDAGTTVWGARHHIVAPIQEIGRHRPAGSFDCIVFNGVFGFGIDDPEDQRAAVKILYDALAPGGLLLVGWNTNLMSDPEERGIFTPYFVPADGLPWPQRTRFALPETHVYDFYKRRDESRPA